MENEEIQEVELENDTSTEEVGQEEKTEDPNIDYKEIKERLERLEKLEKENASLKRDVKKAQKTTSKDEKPDDTLVKKAFLRSADIVDSEEVELALETADKWGVSLDKLVDDEDFKVKLDKFRTQRSNEKATSNIRGSGVKSEAKSTPEYWIAKGTPPTREQVPDRKTRATIARAFLANAKDGKKFYND